MKRIRRCQIVFSFVSVLFYCAFVPIFLIWFSFRVDIGRLSISDMAAYGVGGILLLYGLRWYIGAIISRPKSKRKIPKNSKSFSLLFCLLQLIPPDELVTDGVYSRSRNPMYFGYTLKLIGIGVILRSISFLSIFVPVFTVLEVLWIQIEESQLERRFGNRYRTYKNRTPMFLPRISKLF